MKPLLQEYAAYNAWANRRLYAVISALSEEQANREIISSFPSLYKTIQHIWFAEEIWLQRLKLAEQPGSGAYDFTGTVTALVQQANAGSAQLSEWVEAASEARLQHVFAYRNLKNEHFKQPVYQVLVHVFNHSSYHRGQLVTMLRQVGAEKIPDTDFIVYSRGK